MPPFSQKYLDYIKSPAWFRRRGLRILVANCACERCGCGEWLQVHHRTYERLGHERDDDLEVLCVACHRAITSSHSTN